MLLLIAEAPATWKFHVPEGADHDDNTDNISMFTKMPLLVTMMPITHMFPMVLNKNTNKTMMIMMMMMMMVVVVSMRMRTVMFWRVRFGCKFSFASGFACFSVSSDGFHGTAENVQFHSRMKNLRQWSFLRHVSQPDVAECIVMACIHWTLHWAWLWQPWVSIAVWTLVGSNFALRVFENFLGQEPLVAVLRSGVAKLKCFCGGFGNWLQHGGDNASGQTIWMISLLSLSAGRFSSDTFHTEIVQCIYCSVPVPEMRGLRGSQVLSWFNSNWFVCGDDTLWSLYIRCPNPFAVWPCFHFHYDTTLTFCKSQTQCPFFSSFGWLGGYCCSHINHIIYIYTHTHTHTYTHFLHHYTPKHAVLLRRFFHRKDRWPFGWQ